MGNKVCAFTEEQLEDYQDCTFFTRADILRIHKRYRALHPVLIPDDYKELETQPLLKMRHLLKLPELKENPFKCRICQVFSVNGSGALTFDDFLNMMSVLSDSAPRELKVKYAFKIFDFDGDQKLGPTDLAQTVLSVTGGDLKEDEVQFVVESLLSEADIDETGYLNFLEFEKVLERAPEFLR
ncbi:predicted protein [Nematostella vectensis]|uniref:EF-hand domain-containing protein n=1 Tax=Nematostella vectensis TaxID=45351 RepID=A7SHW4_NEMVE|nr:predicted protein [Nematostella vectensis]|eukprot:XP_001628787.1 predicted protein [Nematostella vectensis]